MTVSLELLSRPEPRPDLFESLLVPVTVPEGADSPSLLDDGRPADSFTPPEAAWLPAPRPEEVAEAISAGGGVEADLWSMGAHDAADVLVAATHAGVGFGPGLQPRASTLAQVWVLLVAAVSALTGEDVRRAWEAGGAGDGAVPAGPGDEAAAAVVNLPRGAREAVRDVITCIRVPAETYEELAAALARDVESLRR